MTETLIIIQPHITIHTGSNTFIFEIIKPLSKIYKIKIVAFRIDMNLVQKYREYAEFIDLKGPLSSSILFWLLFPMYGYRLSNYLNSLVDDKIVFAQTFPANWLVGFYKIINSDAKIIWMCQEPSAFIHSKEWILSINPKYKRFLALIFNFPLKMLDIYFTRKFNYIICNSKHMLSEAKKIYFLSDNKISYTHLALEKKSYSLNLANAKNTRQILVVSSLNRFKNINKAIEALYIFNARSKDKANMVIVGKGPHQVEIEKSIKTLGLTNFVKIVKDLSYAELEKLYSDSGIFIHAARKEAFGLVVLEAMECGAICLVSKLGGPSEIVEDLVSGFYFDTNDSYDLSLKIEQVINLGEENKNNIILNAKKRASQFTTDKMITHIIETLNKI